MSLWQESILIDGSKIDPDITDAVTAGGAILTGIMEGAQSLELTISDPQMKFLRSGALTKHGKPSTRQQDLNRAAWERFAAMRLSFDGVWFRFAGASGAYDAQPWNITMTFEAELATLMRLRDEPYKWSRGRGTRLGFIHNLAQRSQLKDLSDRGILTFTTLSPDPSVKEDVAKVKDADRKKGLSSTAHLTIKGAAINSEQRRNLEIFLTEAEKRNAIERVFLSGLVAGIGESSFLVVPNAAGSDYGGVFQGKFKGTNPQFKIGDTKGMSDSFLDGGKGFQAGGAIKLAASNADLTPGQIAFMVEGDLSNFGGDKTKAEAFYQQHINEAKAILDAWGGAITTVTVRESFEFRAGEKNTSTGKRENYWDASGRLVDDRNWRRFAAGNTLWLGPDSWFFKNRPTVTIHGDQNLATQGVLGLTFDADVGMPVAEIAMRAFAPRWTFPPGAVIEFSDLGPLDGRWLIWQNRLDLTQQDEIADITLRRPAPAKKERAPSTRTRSEDTPDTGTARDRIVKAAKKALGQQTHYRYEQTRPMPSGLFAFPKVVLATGGTTDGILYIDCSAFATLVYKAAGVVDPNGKGYANATFGDRAHYSKGPEGNTGSLIANGKRTSNPQPGDLAFYGPGLGPSGAPGHVGVYIGGGQVIEMGGNPGPRELRVHYRSDFMGYYAYDLTDA